MTIIVLKQEQLKIETEFGALNLRKAFIETGIVAKEREKEEKEKI